MSTPVSKNYFMVKDDSGLEVVVSRFAITSVMRKSDNDGESKLNRRFIVNCPNAYLFEYDTQEKTKAVYNELVRWINGDHK